MSTAAPAVPDSTHGIAGSLSLEPVLGGAGIAIDVAVSDI
jgi:hypothetical protein